MLIENINQKQWLATVSQSGADTALDDLALQYEGWREAVTEYPHATSQQDGDEVLRLLLLLGNLDLRDIKDDHINIVVGEVGAIALGLSPEQPTLNSGRNIV